MTTMEIIQIVLGVLSLIATITVSFLIYWLQRRHEKQLEEIERANHKEQLQIRSDSFIREHENEIDFLPFCVMVNATNKNRKHTRKIYNDFCKCTEELQVKILHDKGLSLDLIKDNSWMYECFKKLKSDITKFKLGRDCLYDGEKYFHKGFETYGKKKWKDTEEVFNRIGEPTMLLKQNDKINLNCYIDEYFYYFIEKRKEVNPTPPIDAMWSINNLGTCDEQNICRWIIDMVLFCCINIHNRRDDKSNIRDNITGAVPATFEDRYYEALLWLYYTYKNF